jgi:hypothetical protein
MEIEQVNKKLEILKYLFWSYTQTKSEEYEIDIETSYSPDSTNNHNLPNFEELSWNISVTLMCPPEITRISYKLKNAENIIESFFKLTNIPLVGNTSFNLAGEPIVETIEDAIKTIYDSKLNYLYFPECKFLIKKEYL